MPPRHYAATPASMMRTPMPTSIPSSIPTSIPSSIPSSAFTAPAGHPAAARWAGDMHTAFASNWGSRAPP
eukprot:860936-Pyramimonas_sp.AAC.2